MSERTTAAALVERLADAVAGDGRRMIVALAGPPGAGKSTFAAWLADGVTARAAGVGRVAVLGMDGFHYDDRVLEEWGERPRKGAPHTFDVDGLAAMLARLRADDGRPVAVPVFDRDIEIARAWAAIIEPSARLVIVEGNYLLLDAPPWSALAPHFDLTVMLEIDEDEVRRRLLERWAELSPEALALKMDGNDMPNVRRVIGESRPADLTLTPGPDAR